MFLADYDFRDSEDDVTLPTVHDVYPACQVIAPPPKTVQSAVAHSLVVQCLIAALEFDAIRIDRLFSSPATSDEVMRWYTGGMLLITNRIEN